MKKLLFALALVFCSGATVSAHWHGGEWDGWGYPYAPIYGGYPYAPYAPGLYGYPGYGYGYPYGYGPAVAGAALGGLIGSAVSHRHYRD